MLVRWSQAKHFFASNGICLKERKKLKKLSFSKIGKYGRCCYISHPNNGNALAGVVGKIHHLLDQVESQNNEIKAHHQ